MTLPLLPAENDPGHARLFACAKRSAAIARLGMADITFGTSLFLLLHAAALAIGAAVLGLLGGSPWLGILLTPAVVLLGAALLLVRASRCLNADRDLTLLLPGTAAHGWHLLERERALPDLSGTGDLALLRNGTATVRIPRPKGRGGPCGSTPPRHLPSQGRGRPIGAPPRPILLEPSSNVPALRLLRH